jgi:hypothetical protein
MFNSVIEYGVLSFEDCAIGRVLIAFRVIFL